MVSEQIKFNDGESVDSEAKKHKQWSTTYAEKMIWWKAMVTIKPAARKKC